MMKEFLKNPNFFKVSQIINDDNNLKKNLSNENIHVLKKSFLQ